MQYKFTGPLFIIGMPRSGTKLLRGLLNEHELIRILPLETNFFHFLDSEWHKFGDLSDYSNFEKFYNSILQVPYFIDQSKSYGNIPCKTWFEMCKDFSTGQVFESLIRHDVNAPFGSDIIWGDKSPSYIIHIKLLYSNYPTARFIHIVRDVRDYCLSINNAWGKNIFRAAQRWNEDVMKCLQDSKTIPMDSFIQIRYEDLLENPENELSKICKFLEVNFDKTMLKLSKPTENIGTAKDQTGVVKSNTRKYQNNMPPKIQKRIESIAYETLIHCGYEIQYAQCAKRLTRIKMNYYQLIDILSLLRFRLKSRGIIGSYKFIKHRLQFFRRI
jgi:hypothetical protein